MHRAPFFFKPLSVLIRSPLPPKTRPHFPALARTMASEQPPAGTHKDPVTGEMISKTSAHFVTSFINPVLIAPQLTPHSELKRREKQRQKDAKKAEAAANAPPQPNAPADANAAEDEEALSPRVE